MGVQGHPSCPGRCVSGSPEGEDRASQPPTVRIERGRVLCLGAIPRTVGCGEASPTPSWEHPQS